MALRGVKVIELVGLAPGPFCGMVLAAFGANVVRIDRTNKSEFDCLTRGKKSVYLDLKSVEGKDIFMKLIASADVLIEPFRPGVMESLSLGPNQLMATNDRLIYARLTGYGQTGPMADKAGHDINYLSIAGILSKLGTEDLPVPPINLIGDFAGGGLLSALGICIALLERHHSGKGQVVDQSITEASAYISTYIWKTMNSPTLLKDFMWTFPEQRQVNLLDGGSPFYGCYRTKDNQFMSVGAIEPQFDDRFTTTIGLDQNLFNRFDLNDWKPMKEELKRIFETKTQTEWIEVFEGIDACVTPVLDLNSAQNYEQNTHSSVTALLSRRQYFRERLSFLISIPRIRILPREPCSTLVIQKRISRL